MRIGLIARQDAGGLAAQSLEFAKNLPIEATLVVDLAELGRGPNWHYEWPNPVFVNGPWIDDPNAVRTFLDQVDVVLSIETFYGAMVCEFASLRRIPTVRYVNPELYKNVEGESHVVLPTNWERERIPNAAVIPQGVTVQPDAFVRADFADTVLHMSAPAMMDRNGTADFYAAMLHTKHGYNAKVVGQKNLTYQLGTQHEWFYDPEFHENRFDFYTPDVDLLILPRRFGGLSLPMLEAASFGIPTLTLDISPQNEWFSKGLVPSEGFDLINMVAGKFEVHRINIPGLTGALDFYATHSITELSQDALNWAKSNSWDIVAPMWLEFFERILS